MKQTEKKQIYASFIRDRIDELRELKNKDWYKDHYQDVYCDSYSDITLLKQLITDYRDEYYTRIENASGYMSDMGCTDIKEMYDRTFESEEFKNPFAFDGLTGESAFDTGEDIYLETEEEENQL